MSDLNSAFNNTWVNARSFMMNAFNLTEDEAITAVTTVADFGVTQVVDGECYAPVQCPCSTPRSFSHPVRSKLAMAVSTPMTPTPWNCMFHIELEAVRMTLHYPLRRSHCPPVACR